MSIDSIDITKLACRRFLPGTFTEGDRRLGRTGWVAVGPVGVLSMQAYLYSEGDPDIISPGLRELGDWVCDYTFHLPTPQAELEILWKDPYHPTSEVCPWLEGSGCSYANSHSGAFIPWEILESDEMVFNYLRTHYLTMYTDAVLYRTETLEKFA